MLDKRLLVLERYIEEENVSFEDLSRALNISKRQLSRLLKVWDEKNCINYTPAFGRGNKMNISMNVNVEKALLEEFLEYKDKMTISEVEAYLNLPWPKDSIDKIQSVILKDISEMEGPPYDSMMIDFIFQIPESLDPKEANDFFSVHLMNQVCDTLYTLSPNGEIEYNLLNYDEWEKDCLHLYLKKDIYFSDGTALTSSTVKQSIDSLKREGEYTHHFKNIANITVYDSTHLSLEVTHQKHIIKYQLSQPVTGIYTLSEDGNFIGTGAYVISDKTTERIILKANLNSHRPLPDIRKVYLLVNQTKIKQYYTENYNNIHSFSLHAATNFLLFNPLDDRFTAEERKLLIWTMANSVYKVFRENNITLNERFVPINDLSETYRPKMEEYLSLAEKGTIRTLATDRTKPYFDKMKRTLAAHGIDIEYTLLTNEDYFNTDISAYTCDVIMMQENYHHVEPFKFFDLMTHCKFKDWYAHVEDFQSFYNGTFIVGREGETIGGFDIENHILSEESNQLLERLKKEYRIAYLYDLYRYITLPSGFKSLQDSNESFMDYSKIIKEP